MTSAQPRAVRVPRGSGPSCDAWPQEAATGFLPAAAGAATVEVIGFGVPVVDVADLAAKTVSVLGELMRSEPGKATR